jgi:hypothetical protein
MRERSIVTFAPLNISTTGFVPGSASSSESRINTFELVETTGPLSVVIFTRSSDTVPVIDPPLVVMNMSRSVVGTLTFKKFSFEANVIVLPPP